MDSIENKKHLCFWLYLWVYKIPTHIRRIPKHLRCKNQERMNIWSAWEQAINNRGIYEPLVVIKKNGVDPLVVLDAKVFMDYVKVFNNELVD